MKNMKIVTSIILFLSLVFPVYSFQSLKEVVSNITYAEASTNKKSVSTKTARGIIENYINDKEYISHWRGASIKEKHKLYNVDDTLLGYYYEVKEGNNILGYFITSATFEYEPILEYGEGELSQFDIESTKGNKIYYLGGLDYKFAKDNKELKQKHDDIKQKTLNKLEKEGKKNTKLYEKIEKEKLKSIQKNSEHKKLWDEYLQDNKQSSSFFSPNVARAASSYKVLAVDDIEQDRNGIDHPGSACAPTVGAMIADYYHDVKGYNVLDNAYYGSWAKLVNHLYDEMNTNWYGTSITEWSHGMYDHVTHKVHPSSWGYNYLDATYNEHKFTQSIESDDPVALRFDRYKSSSSVYTEYHFITGIGFDKNGSYSGDLHVAIKDPDDNSSGTKWIDWTVNDQDMEIAYLY
ncbi:C39 family peptidase [Pseudalkalibacillus sp. JSM 102089]|uniref:C39 family peptidase n=1 Tax=Pseudalkalibacillus sp. JSM 102089 TaxID=3229856 RepID=UPI0035256040